ncbi:MAG: glycerate kinase [Anaerolineae bacterium]
MKVIIAPNAFKGSLDAAGVAEAMAAGVRRVFPQAEILELPIADGGDGTLPLILRASGGEMVQVSVRDPLGRPVQAAFGVLPDGNTAVIEMATASGLRLLTLDELNPMRASTTGTGQLITAALDHGCRRIIIGVGGSATVEGGIGMAKALGVRLLDAQDQPIGEGGAALMNLHHIDLSQRDPRLAETEIIVASDVENPLVGEEGAARIFGPQKGATPEMVAQLEAGLTHYGQIIERETGIHVLTRPAMGAAGGITAALVAFLGARIESGAGVILDLMSMDTHLQGASLLLTGEGRIDAQTAYGKAPVVVARMAQKHGVPVTAFAGSLSDDADAVLAHGIDALVPIVSRPMPLEEAMRSASQLIEEAAYRAMLLVQLGFSTKG